MEAEKVIVIGGGASGLMAALTAAEEPGRRVLLLERQQRAGRKLMATGNGRCNLTNTGASPADYHGADARFPVPALEAFPPELVLEYFRGLGLLTVEEYGGRVYPLSNSANSVLDVLRFALERMGVELRTSCSVREIRKNKKGFTVLGDGLEERADKLILACGGCAGTALGGTEEGYRLLEGLGLRRTALHPALVQLLCDSRYPASLKGVRADCALELRKNGAVLAESTGELQFTDTGVSGPAAFDVSRAAAAAGKGLTVSADFLRDYSYGYILELLRRRKADCPELPCQELLTGMLHNRLGRMLVKYAGINGNDPMRSLNDGALKKLVGCCKDFELPVKGTEGFDKAQVTAGGISTGDFDPNTLECRHIPGLFACGELLDVDGNCGGFNLQWAWASGRMAGRLGK